MRASKELFHKTSNARPVVKAQKNPIRSAGTGLTISREIGDRGGVAIHSWNLGVLCEQRGDLPRAAELMQMRVAYEREIGHANLAKDEAYLADVRRRAAEGGAAA